MTEHKEKVMVKPEKKEEEKAAEQKIPQKKAQKQKPVKRIYVGPTIPGIAAKNTIYSGGLSKALAEVICKKPYFSNLVVPVGEYPSAEKMISNKKGYVYDAYKMALEGRAK